MSKRTGKMESSRFFYANAKFSVVALFTTAHVARLLFRVFAVMNLAGTVLAILGGMFSR